MRNMFVDVVAALGLLACLLLLARMGLPQRRRQRLDAAVREAAAGLRRLPWRLRHRRHVQQDAAEAAQEAIRRARGSGRTRSRTQWDGNVARPDAFDRPPPRSPKDLH
jgi:hypothetical protein